MALKPPAVQPPTPAVDGELDRLLGRAQKGDPDAWRALVDRLRRLVYSIPRRYRLDDDAAADVFLTVFGALHRNLDRIESGRALPSWLATTTTRECLRLVRAASRATTSETLDEIVAREERTAEDEAIRADDAYRVRAAMGRMAARCRDLLDALYAEDEAAYDEIAERLGMPIGSIGPTRARCLDKLRRMLEAEGFCAD